MRNQHPEDIKAAVRKSGITLADLARSKRISTSAARAALYRPSPCGNRAIAERLNTTCHALWPEWFDANDQRITKWRKPSTGRGRGNSQKRTAA